MKIDQIAFYSKDEAEDRRIKEQFGLLDAQWIKDRVIASSSVNDGPFMTNVADLQFNYDLGIELEILRYIDGLHWQFYNPHLMFNSFISHVGIHLEDGEPFPEMKHCRLVQETKTITHTAKYLTERNSPAFGRTYHYKIFAMSQGSYIKYIRRIHPK